MQDAVVSLGEKLQAFSSTLSGEEAPIFLSVLGAALYEIDRGGEGEVVGHDAQLVKVWHDVLADVGHDAQLANVDLQNVLQKQQQTLQMMSNISTMLHDTASSVIRKIGG